MFTICATVSAHPGWFDWAVDTAVDIGTHAAIEVFELEKPNPSSM